MAKRSRSRRRPPVGARSRAGARDRSSGDPLRCELCGYRSDGTARDRFGHLRRSHASYALGLLLRMAAPLVLLVLVLPLVALGAPQWTLIGALIVSFGMLFFGKQISRGERSRAGVRATLPLWRTLREGGLGFLVVVPIVALLILLRGR